MNRFTRALFLISAAACIAVFHLTIRHDTASIFLGPVGISILLASISPTPVVLVFIIALLCELISTLPFGSIFAIFVIPFVVRWAMRFPETDFSWKFFYFVFFSAALQILFLVAAKNIFHVVSIYAIPWQIMAMQLVFTSIFTYGISAFYHEFSSRV